MRQKIRPFFIGLIIVTFIVSVVFTTFHNDVKIGEIETKIDDRYKSIDRILELRTKVYFNESEYIKWCYDITPAELHIYYNERGGITPIGQELLKLLCEQD